MTRVAREWTEETRGQAACPSDGCGKTLPRSSLYGLEPTGQVRISDVTIAVAMRFRRDHIACAERFSTKGSINTMVDLLSPFASEGRASHAMSAPTASSAASDRARVRHLEGPHRQRQPARRQPYTQVRICAICDDRVARVDRHARHVDVKGEFGTEDTSPRCGPAQCFCSEVTRVPRGRHRSKLAAGAMPGVAGTWKT